MSVIYLEMFIHKYDWPPNPRDGLQTQSSVHLCRIPPFAPKALPAMEVSNQRCNQQQRVMWGKHLNQCRDEKKTELSVRTPTSERNFRMCLIRCEKNWQSPTVRGPYCSSARNPTRLSFFAANLRKPRMCETCLIGVSVSGEHCSRTWSQVVYAAEQTKILGAAWIYRCRPHVYSLDLVFSRCKNTRQDIG